MKEVCKSIEQNSCGMIYVSIRKYDKYQEVINAKELIIPIFCFEYACLTGLKKFPW